jgi:predicted anti-sigma-YlaC factor YlaD
MKCDEVREFLEENGNRNAPESVLTHLASCAECDEWWRDWQTMAEGFRLLSRESGPEPSWGFSERVVRRLGESVEAERRGADLIERAGRRVLWATLALTLTAVLALVVPSSGPVRAASEPDYLIAQPQATTNESYQIVDVDNTDNSTTQAVAPASAGEKK